MGWHNGGATTREDTFSTAYSHSDPKEAVVRQYEDAYRDFHGRNIMSGSKHEQDAWLTTLAWIAKQQSVTLRSIHAAHKAFLVE